MNPGRTAIVLLTLMPAIASAQGEVTPLERDVRYVRDNALAVLIVRPAKMLETESLNQNPLADLAGPTGIKPSDVETLVIAAVPGGAPTYDIGVVFSIRFKENAPQATLRRTLSPESEKIEDWPFPVFDGQSQRHRMSLAFPTPKTAVFSTDGGAFYDALSIGGHKAFEKSRLRTLCGDKTNVAVFAAGDVDRFVHATTFAGGTVNPAAGAIHEALPKPAVGRLRARFDLEGTNALVVEVTASDQSVSSDKLRDGLQVLKRRASSHVSGIVDALVKATPALSDARDSLQLLTSRLQIVAQHDHVRVQLADSLKPADAWWHMMKCVGLYRDYQLKQMNQLRARLNLMNLAIALHNYHNVFSRWPMNIENKDGKALLSWRVRILPYMGNNGLYQQFKLDEAWDSPHNKTLLKHMPSSFGIPGVKPSDGLTRVKFPVLEGAPPKSLAGIKDGTASTVAMLESKEQVPWTKPVDHEVSAEDPWGGIVPNGWFCFADAHVSKIDKAATGAKLLHAFTPAGGDKFSGEVTSPTDQDATPFIKSHLSSAGAVKTLNGPPKSQRAKSAAAAEFLELINSSDSIVVGLALLGLESIEAPYDWKKLKPLLDSRFDFVRNKAIELMAKTEQPGVVGAIFRPDGPDQKTTWQMLYETSLGKKYAARELLPLLKHKSRNYRIDAGFAIAAFGGEKYRTEIEALLKDPDEIVRKEAANMLKVIDPGQ